jgi:hypothetical protein
VVPSGRRNSANAARHRHEANRGFLRDVYVLSPM